MPSSGAWQLKTQGPSAGLGRLGLHHGQLDVAEPHAAPLLGHVGQPDAGLVGLLAQPDDLADVLAARASPASMRSSAGRMAVSTKSRTRRRSFSSSGVRVKSMGMGQGVSSGSGVHLSASGVAGKDAGGRRSRRLRRRRGRSPAASRAYVRTTRTVGPVRPVGSGRRWGRTWPRGRGSARSSRMRSVSSDSGADSTPVTRSSGCLPQAVVAMAARRGRWVTVASSGPTPGGGADGVPNRRWPRPRARPGRYVSRGGSRRHDPGMGRLSSTRRPVSRSGILGAGVAVEGAVALELGEHRRSRAVASKPSRSTGGAGAQVPRAGDEVCRAQAFVGPCGPVARRVD